MKQESPRLQPWGVSSPPRCRTVRVRGKPAVWVQRAKALRTAARRGAGRMGARPAVGCGGNRMLRGHGVRGHGADRRRLWARLHVLVLGGGTERQRVGVGERIIPDPDGIAGGPRMTDLRPCATRRRSTPRNGRGPASPIPACRASHVESSPSRPRRFDPPFAVMTVCPIG